MVFHLVWSGQVRIRGFECDYDCYDCYDYYDYYDYDYYDYDYCDYDYYDYDYYDYNYYSFFFFLLLSSYFFLFLLKTTTTTTTTTTRSSFPLFRMSSRAHSKRTESKSSEMSTQAEMFNESECRLVRINL